MKQKLEDRLGVKEPIRRFTKKWSKLKKEQQPLIDKYNQSKCKATKSRYYKLIMDYEIKLEQEYKVGQKQYSKKQSEVMINVHETKRKKSSS